MARLPFDPDRIRPADGKTRTPARRGVAPLTVTQVAALIRDVLAQAVPTPIRVIGEVSNLSTRAHWFFSLKDEQATLRCVCFATHARRVGFALQDGMEVVCTGRLDYYDAQGHLQLYVDKIEPVGQGALELRYRALCEELRQLGYFDPQRKKPLPLIPQRIAVVTSRSGAALQDVINTARKRWAGCRLCLLDVHVQGAAAAPEIAAAIDALSRDGPRLGIDAIILTRGGGSIEDLWAFNERAVADALYRCKLPVVAAIGHETDVTIAELVADQRAATPTQAAMALVPDRAALQHQVDQLAGRLLLLVRRQVEHDRHRLAAVARHPLFRRPEHLLVLMRERLGHVVRALHAAVVSRNQTERQRLETVTASLPAAANRRLAAERQRFESAAQRLPAAITRQFAAQRDGLEALARQLQAVSPLNVLQRGYSCTFGPDGHVLKRAMEVRAGERITTMLAEGKIASVVEDAAAAPGGWPGLRRPQADVPRAQSAGAPGHEDLAPATPPGASARSARRLRRARAAPADSDQLDLFGKSP